MSEVVKEDPIFPQPDVIDIVALFKLLWKKKFIIAGSSFIVAVITAIISLQMPNIYRSTTTLLPVSTEVSSAFGQYAGLAAMAGISAPGQSGTDVEKILAILTSRTLKERVINELNLIPELLEEEPDKLSPLFATTLVFSENFHVNQDKKTGVISISYDNKSPELAAKIVNYVTEVLINILNEKNLTVSSKKLLLTEKQLNEKRSELEVLKNKLLEFQRRTQVLVPEAQAEGVMELYSTLIQQKITLEVDLKTYKSALSDSNPKIKAKEKQLEAIQYQLDNLSNITSDGKFDTTDVPENIAEYSEITAELELAQKMYLALFAQWEQLKMQEQEDQLYVEIIDLGVVQERKYKPKRSIIVLLSVAITFILLSFIFIIGNRYE